MASLAFHIYPIYGDITQKKAENMNLYKTKLPI